MGEIFLRGTNKCDWCEFFFFFVSNTLLHDFVAIAGCLRCCFPVPSMFEFKETSNETGENHS